MCSGNRLTEIYQIVFWKRLAEYKAYNFSKEPLLLLVALITLAGAQKDKYTDETRPYEFRFNIDGYQHRHEKKDDKGIIMGEFGFITPDGYYRVTVYATDENGNFKILSMKSIKVGFPPGSGLDPFTGARIGDPAATPQKSPAPLPPSATVTTVRTPPSPAPSPLTTTTLKSIFQGHNGCGSCVVPTTTKKPPPAPPFPQAPQQPQSPFSPSAPLPQQPSPTPSPPGSPAGVPPSQPNIPTFPENIHTPFPPGPSNIPTNNIQPSAPNLPEGNKPYPVSPSTPSFPPASSITPLLPSPPKIPTSNQPAPILPNKPSFPADLPVNPVDNNEFISNRVDAAQPQFPPNSPPLGSVPSIPGPPAGTVPVAVPPNQPGPSNQPSPGVPAVQSFKPTISNQQPPSSVSGSLPPGVNTNDIMDLLYRFNYTVGFHGHHESGYRNGDKEGDYFVNGRDGISRQVTYIANEFGYQPNITLVNLGLQSVDTPKEETEKEYGLKGYEFKWFYKRACELDNSCV